MTPLTVRQVAERIGLSEWAVRRAINDGELVAYRPRGQIRIFEADYEMWLALVKVVPHGPASRNAWPRLAPAPASVPGGSFRARARQQRVDTEDRP